MTSDLALLGLELGYVAGVAVLTKALLSVTKHVQRWRTASGIRRTFKAMEEAVQAPHETRGYRTNAIVEETAPVAPSSWLSRVRAERAARYVQKLEDEATMNG